MTIIQQMEIDRLTKQVDEAMLLRTIEPFAKSLGEAIATVLANIPFAQWPALGVLAFNHLQRGAPTAAQLYKANLPKV